MKTKSDNAFALSLFILDIYLKQKTTSVFRFGYILNIEMTGK